MPFRIGHPTGIGENHAAHVDTVDEAVDTLLARGVDFDIAFNAVVETESTSRPITVYSVYNHPVVVQFSSTGTFVRLKHQAPDLQPAHHIHIVAPVADDAEWEDNVKKITISMSARRKL